MMLDQFEGFFTTEQDQLRLEAMDLFERCLTEGNSDHLMAFIETQITSDPPRLDLLQQVADDLHSRLLALREYHFDICSRVLRGLQNDFQADLSQAALQTVERLELDALVQVITHHNPQISKRERALIRQGLKPVLEIAVQLRNDIVMIEQLTACLADWLSALTASEARRSWRYSWKQNTPPVIH